MYFFALLTWASAHSTESAIAAARREGTKNKTVLASTADGLIVFDVEGKLSQINQAALSMLGGMDAAQLLESTQLESETGVWKIGAPNERTLAVTRAPMFESGKNVGTVLSVRDFTRETAVEEMKDSILAIASHELKTPIAAARSLLELLRRERPPSISESARETVEDLHRSVQRLALLVNQFLDQASLQAGMLKIVNSDLEIAALADKVEDVVLGRLGEMDHKVQLTFQIDERLPEWVIGDVNRLWEVVVNLVGNAIKFTDEGHIDVRFSLIDPHRWSIEVSDTGIGIPAPMIEFIFDPIRRAPDYKTRPRQGAGLGLSITKRLVELMGGSIAVESTVGKGSTFTVSLPMEAA